MKHYVELRTFLEQPARKCASPASIGALHVELDERSGQLLLLPGRGLLACPQANDSVADAHRLIWPKGEIAGDPVTLVEQPDHRDTLAHRGDAGVDSLSAVGIHRHHIAAAFRLDGRRRTGACRAGHRIWAAEIIPAARRQRRCDGDHPRDQSGLHSSGLHAS